MFTSKIEIKMFLYYIFYFINFARAANIPTLDNLSGWNYINLHCRDNDNNPVDWWYIYKPPNNVGPTLDSGRNFSFITPYTAGRWVPSDRYIEPLPPNYHSDNYRINKDFIIKSRANSATVQIGPPSLSVEELKISAAKYKDLRELCNKNIIPKRYYQEYLSMRHDRTIRDALAEMKSTYSDYLAMVSYGGKEKDDSSPGSSALGLMMADEMGGMWIEHTVKGFPDLTQDRPTFPEEELSTGQLIVCMSLDLVTLNEVAVSLRTVSPRVLELKIPSAVKSFLPDWEYMSVTQVRTLTSKSSLQFTTRKGSLRAEIMVRRPGEKKCLYKSFARSKNIVLDVYKHDLRSKPVCDKKYSVRNINAISLKYKEKVFYIDNTSDRIGFAVSTAAHWQRRSSRSKPAQYWTCTSNLEKVDGSHKGGLIFCVEDYRIWWSFDNLKVKEPEC